MIVSSLLGVLESKYNLGILQAQIYTDVDQLSKEEKVMFVNDYFILLGST